MVINKLKFMLILRYETMTDRLLIKEQMVNKSFFALASFRLSLITIKKTLGKEATE